LDKQKRKNEIRPNFQLILLSPYGILLGETKIEKASIDLRITNLSGNATLLEYIELGENSQSIDLHRYLNKAYFKGDRIDINIPWLHLKKPKSELLIHFKLIYKDEDDNKYFQIYKGTYKSIIEESKPIEIIESNTLQL